jgi:hypothetical protein
MNAAIAANNRDFANGLVMRPSIPAVAKAGCLWVVPPRWPVK